MSEHRAIIRWKRTDSDFAEGRYSREHSWSFDGGVTVAASASPAVVPAPYANPSHVDPEEALVAALSSCHMLTFLYLASRAGYVVESYEDAAVGVMTKNPNGVPWMSEVTLRPRIIYGGDARPTPAEEEQLNRDAHRGCYIANSVKTEVRVDPVSPEDRNRQPASNPPE